MDVLDHSCSKLGFGGKMCIDGTKKFEEEVDENYSNPQTLPFSKEIEEQLQQQYPEIKAVFAGLLDKGISCIILSVKKDKPGHIRQLHHSIAAGTNMHAIKMVLYVEHTVEPSDLPTSLWRFCNNLDPKRDSHLFQSDSFPYVACLGLDGTRKTKELDNFQRDWPNIIVADDDTIKRVDEKWSALGIGPFISSPSLKYKSQLYGEEAVVGA
jgi:4-hydroxy-3-polyprenylbenzoate decarboxylase